MVAYVEKKKGAGATNGGRTLIIVGSLSLLGSAAGLFPLAHTPSIYLRYFAGQWRVIIFFPPSFKGTFFRVAEPRPDGEGGLVRNFFPVLLSLLELLAGYQNDALIWAEQPCKSSINEQKLRANSP